MQEKNDNRRWALFSNGLCISYMKSAMDAFCMAARLNGTYPGARYSARMVTLTEMYEYSKKVQRGAEERE